MRKVKKKAPKPRAKAPVLRVKWEYDTDPDLSHLEQWDTAEKYYGEAPKCSHGNSMKYVENHEWSSYCHRCEDEGKDECATFDGHGCDKGAVAIDVDGKRGGLGEHKHIPFETYMRYYGNYDRHVVLACVVEKKCPHCGEWSHAASVYGVDFMDDDKWTTGTFNAKEALALRGYQADVAKDLIAEAKAL
jgi:hypothetical protein